MDTIGPLLRCKYGLARCVMQCKYGRLDPGVSRVSRQVFSCVIRTHSCCLSPVLRVTIMHVIP